MPVVQATRRHQIYLVERWGDTLVVGPRGDAAGFSLQVVNQEMATVLGVIEASDTKHLVVDLSRANYFGSVVLGALIQMGNAVRQRGGRVAMCGASGDMQDVLRLMKLDQMWEPFRDLRAALGKVAKIPVREQLWGQRKLIGGLCFVLAAIGGYLLLPPPKYAKEEYAVVKELWTEVRDRRAMAGVDEWERLTKKCRNRVEPLVVRLDRLNRRRGSRGAEPFVIYAARDHLIPALDRTLPPNEWEYHQELGLYFLRCAEAALENRPIPYSYDMLTKGPGPAADRGYQLSGPATGVPMPPAAQVAPNPAGAPPTASPAAETPPAKPTSTP
jgi:anti-anti-sigma factor